MSHTHQMIKPFAVALFAAIVDHQILHEGKTDTDSITSSIVFGISSGIAVNAVVVSTALAPPHTGAINISDNSFFGGKTLEERILEVGLEGTGGYLANRFLGSNFVSYVKRVCVFAAGDFVAEYCCDYLCGEPFAYFNLIKYCI